ncbi:MAG: hypothetical protein R2834_07920 [Rhodothermales bacterium]
MQSPFEVGETIHFEDESYLVLRVVPLKDFSRLPPDKERWGTHVLLLKRASDGRRCVANWFESGTLTPPEDWLEDYI